MTPIRVLLVDDSAIARRIIIAALKAHPEVEVAAAVPSGELALARLPEVRPDAVILDVEMPGMNGVETLKRIRETSATLPVIMFSALTDAGALITVQALAAGASDYVCKPSTLKGTSPEQVVAEELVPKLLALCGRPSASTLIPRKTSVAVPSIAAPLDAERERQDAPRAGRVSGPSIEVIVLACSTGGPNALAELIPRLPASLSAPVLIVQHMPPLFTRHLAERLNNNAALRVREAEGGERPVAGEVWIAPGDYHLELHRVEGVLTTRLNQGPRENSCRPAADVLFRSAAAVCGSRALGVVLTGMGQDGLEGCRALAQAGAKIVTQDEASCVVWGMPKAVELAGLATVVCPLSGIADEISRRTARKISLGGAA
jgi:two-component system, chemotaxis family, protein-glutamate methylesterase/glutaminase